jgi:hypothetical protein
MNFRLVIHEKTTTQLFLSSTDTKLWYLKMSLFCDSVLTAQDLFEIAQQSKYQSVDRAVIVAPQNLHFTGSLLWSEETIWPLLHAGHMRLRLRSLRRIVDTKNGFKFLTPSKCLEFSTYNKHHS